MIDTRQFSFITAYQNQKRRELAALSSRLVPHLVAPLVQSIASDMTTICTGNYQTHGTT
jgi:hypothetical protein